MNKCPKCKHWMMSDHGVRIEYGEETGCGEIEMFGTGKKVILPDGWHRLTMACPIQYYKIIKKGKTFYEGYLRSRYDSPFSISIIKHPKNEKVWQHHHVDFARNDPPLKSMKIVNKKLKELK